MPGRRDRDAARAVLGGLDPAAGHAVRDDPQEQLPLAGGPGLYAGLLGRGALGLALDVMGGSLDQHAPALAAGYVDLVDLERHQVVTAGDPGLQVLVERAEEHTSELQSQFHLVCRLLLEKKKKKTK